MDLLVVMNTKLTSREQKRAIYKTLRDRPFSIDLIVRTPEELERRISGRDYFLREVVSKGKALYEQLHK